MWRKRCAVVLAQDLVARQQLVAAQQQLGEIDHAFALALLVVGRVELGHAPRDLVVDVGTSRARMPSSFWPLMNHAISRGGKRSSSTFMRLHQALDRGELVLRVEDLEGCGRPGLAVVRAQHAVAQAVEGADPHAARVDRQHRA